MGNTPNKKGARYYSGSSEFHLLSGGESRDIIIWDTKERCKSHKIKGAHNHTICDIVELGDGRHVVTSSFDSTIKIWDMKTMKSTRTLKGHKDAVRKVCIIGDLCLSASKDNTVKIWNINSGELVDTYLSYCTGVSDIKSIDKNTIATTNNTSIRLWDVNKKKLVQSYSTHFDWVISLAFDEKKNLLFSASWDRKICLWDPRVRGLLTKPVATIENKNQINSMLYAPLKDWVLVGDQAGCISIFDMRMVQRYHSKSWKFVDQFGQPMDKKKEEFSKKPIIHDNPHSEVVFKLCWMDKDRFASCSADKTIRIYNITKLIATGYTLRDKDPITTIMCFADPSYHVGNFCKLHNIKKMKEKMKKKIKKGEVRILQEFRKKVVDTTSFRKYKNLDILGIYSKFWKDLSKKREEVQIMEEKVGILYCTANLLNSENKRGLIHKNLNWDHVKINEEGKVIVINAVNNKSASSSSKTTTKMGNNIYAFGVMMYSILWDIFDISKLCSCNKENNQKKEEKEEFDYHDGQNCTLLDIISKNERKYPQILINLIKDCWNEEIENRPSYEVIIKTLTTRKIIEDWRIEITKKLKEEEEEENEGEEEEEEEKDIVEMYLEKKEYSKAISFITKSIKSSSSSSSSSSSHGRNNNNQKNICDLYCKRGKVYRLMREYTKSIKDFSKAIKLNPKCSELFLKRGSTYYEMGEYEKTIKDCTKSIDLINNIKKEEEEEELQQQQQQQEEELRDIYYRRGRAYQQLENTEKAIEDFTEAIKKCSSSESSSDDENDNKCALYLHFRGQLYLEAEDPENALEDFNAAIEKQPNNVQHYEGRGETYHDLKKYKEAVDDYSKSIELDPLGRKGTQGYRLRATAYVDMKEFKKALKDIQKASEIHPDEMDYCLFRVEILLELKEYQIVVDECNVVIALSQNSEGNDDDEEEEDIDINFSSWYMNRGMAWYHLEEFENALKDVKEAIDLDDVHEILSEEERDKLEKLVKDIKEKMKKK